jgi:hypothetical protein
LAAPPRRVCPSGFDVGEADIGPAVCVGFDVVAASMVAAVDQHIADAGFAHFAEGHFCGLVVMPVCPKGYLELNLWTIRKARTAI